MTLSDWGLAIVLWCYFSLTSVRQSPDETAALETGPLSWRTSARAGVVLGLLIARRKAFWTIDHTNLLAASFCLTTLIEPLNTFSPKANSKDVFAFFLTWSLARVDTFVKVGAVAVIFGTLTYFHLFPNPKWQSEFLYSHFALRLRPQGGLELPLWLYAVWLFMLVVKALMLFGVPAQGILQLVRPLCGFICGVIVLILFYNLCGFVDLRCANWQAPTGGVLSGLAFSFLTDWFWAFGDEASSGGET